MDPNEATLITEQLGILFGDEDGPGIELVDPKHMLGVEKIRKSVNGVHSIKLTQPGFIDNLWDKFGGYRGKASAPDRPFPRQAQTNRYDRRIPPTAVWTAVR
jgi:hypothetical protein